MLKSALCVIARRRRELDHVLSRSERETTCVLHLGLKRGLMLLWTRLRMMMASVGQISFPANARVCALRLTNTTCGKRFGLGGQPLTAAAGHHMRSRIEQRGDFIVGFPIGR